MTTKGRKRKSQNSNATINNADAVAGKGKRKKVKICETQQNVVSKVNTTANNSDSDFEDSNSHQPVAQLSKKQVVTVHKESATSKGSKKSSPTASAKQLDAQGINNPSPAAKGKIGRKKGVDETVVGKKIKFQTRTTPKPLSKAIKNLNDDQKKAVRSMGLGGLLGLKMTEVPGNLAYWLLDSFDAKTYTVQLSEGSFHILKRDVRNVLGLPSTGRKLVVMKRSAPTKMLTNWRKTYGSDTPDIKCTEIVEHLKRMKTSDDMFKLNFIVLFFSTMVQSTKNQYCDQRILNAIEKPDDVKEFNWCEYILHSLRTSKMDWDSNRNGQFTGPITFLMALYMDRVEIQHCKIGRQMPIIKNLTVLM